MTALYRATTRHLTSPARTPLPWTQLIREPVLATGERNGPPNIKKSERGSATADSAYAEEVVVPLGQD
ncbi:hypothetical protein MAHJHV47_44960 [Mycobacterium avium subsp. hominissuis]